MAYDSDRGVTVMFGGHRIVADPLPDFVYFNDTWEYDGSQWQRITIDGPSPLWRTASAMCYDTVRKEMILAGGFNSHEDEKDGYLHDTWVYRATAPGRGLWSRTSDLSYIGIDPLAGAVAGHGMVFDTRRGVAVLVGGTKGKNSFVSAPDTDRTSEVQERWSSSQNWSRLNHLFDYIIKGDAGRYQYYEGPTGHVLVYDSDQGMISLGGGAYYYFIHYDEWQDLDWQQFFPLFVGSPFYGTPIRNRPLGGTFIGARRNFAAAYDTDRKRIVAFGGQLAGDNRDNHSDPGSRLDEIVFARNTNGVPYYSATQLDIPTPPARELHAMVYDIRRKCTVLFGGSRGLGTLCNDTWEYGLGSVPLLYVNAKSNTAGDGSLANPVRSVTQAVNMAGDCKTVLTIRAGDYREGAFKITKPLRLQAAEGPARISLT